jgi:hypothetical protein
MITVQASFICVHITVHSDVLAHQCTNIINSHARTKAKANCIAFETENVNINVTEDGETHESCIPVGVPHMMLAHHNSHT